MRHYWLRIVVGACAIFAVGYGGVYIVRKSIGRVHHLAESSDPVSIPLPFVPFNVDGARQGTFRLIRIERDAPKSVSSLTLRIKLSDSADVDHLKDCHITLAGNGHDFDPSRGFRCVNEDADSGLVEFGEVEFSSRNSGDFTVPLMLDSAAVADIRKTGQVHVPLKAGEAEQAGAAVQADSIRDAVNKMVDSIVRANVPPKPDKAKPHHKPG